MSAKSVRAYEQHRASLGRPVLRPLRLRDSAKRMRERAAELLALANELDEAADAAGEPR